MQNAPRVGSTRRRWIVVTGFIVTAVVTAACGSSGKSAAPAASTQPTTSASSSAVASPSAPAPSSNAPVSSAAAPATAAPDNIVLGIALSPPKMVFLAPYVADAQGFFAKQNINVKFLSMPNGLETELGTTTGAINFGFSAATDPIESAAAGSPIHAVWSYAPRLDTQCIASGDVTTAKDLVGKNVGSTGTGGFSYTQVYACLKPGGVDVNQVKLINMTRAQFVPSLVSNRIKAAVFHVDDAYTVQHSGIPLKVLSNEADALPQWWYGAVSVLDSYASAHADLVKRFLTAMVQTDRWMSDPANRDAVLKIAEKETQEDPAAVAYAYDYIVKRHLWTLNSGMDQSSESYTAQQLLTFKEIDKLPSYSAVVDESYINAVLDKLGRVPE